MCAQTARLSDRQLKAVRPKDKDYVLTDGDGLQLRARVNRSMQWNFNYRHPVTKKSNQHGARLLSRGLSGASSAESG